MTVKNAPAEKPVEKLADNAPEQAGAPGDLNVGSGELQAMKQIADSDVKVYDDMPKIGDKCMLEAVFGRMVNPGKPGEADELAPGKITKAVFDEWHRVQWRFGKIRRAEP